MHCWRDCENNCCCGWRPHLLLGWVVENQFQPFGCSLTSAAPYLCFQMTWEHGMLPERLKIPFKVEKGSCCPFSVRAKQRGMRLIHRLGCCHSKWAARAELHPKQWACSLLITARSEQQIKRRCTAIELATMYSLLSRAFTTKQKHTKKVQDNPLYNLWSFHTS